MTAVVEVSIPTSTGRDPVGTTPGAPVRYLQGYGSVFDGPHWKNNLLLGSVCSLIPIIGPIVFDGYCYEVIELKIREPGRPNPPFEFNRFVEYLTRGIWPFLIQLVCQFVLQPVIMILSYAFIIPLAIFAGTLREPTGPLVFGLGMALYVIVVMSFALVLGLVLFPLLLRAGLAQDFVKAFDVRWIRDFIRRMWLEVFLAQLFFLCTVHMLLLLGLALCGIGVLAAGTVVNLAGMNIASQIYNLYLARGGTPIPLKAPLVAATLPAPVKEPAPVLQAGI